jgi:hypothetical protein
MQGQAREPHLVLDLQTLPAIPQAVQRLDGALGMPLLSTYSSTQVQAEWVWMAWAWCQQTLHRAACMPSPRLCSRCGGSAAA